MLSSHDLFAPLKITQIREFLRKRENELWVVLTTIIAFSVFLSTMQTEVNGSLHAYATDVGEIQNALPRWGLIHRSGYPQYTALGSLFVALLRLVGIQPAASTSLFSALWGAIAAGLLVALAQELGMRGPAAMFGALAMAFSTSMWVFASLAEVHTLTVALSLATLLYAARFGRTGTRRDLLLLSVFLSQVIIHQRSAILLIPAVLILIWPRWRTLWHNAASALGIALLAPLTYLYMPLRVWTGATWVFGSPGTWKGFWEMVMDNRAERVFDSQAQLQQWWARLNITLEILAHDMLWPLIILGLVGVALLALRKGKWQASLAMTLTWILNLILSLVIWRDRVIDAQLAAKLPVTAMAGLGLALIVESLGQYSRWARSAALVVCALVLAGWTWSTRPFILSITRDTAAEAVIETAVQVTPPNARPATLAASWGMDYWALTYAQECRGQLPGLNLVDHNADFNAILDRGDRLLILGKSLYVFPVSSWEARLGRLYLVSAAPGVVEIARTPPLTEEEIPADVNLDLGNGLVIRSALVEQTAPDRLLVTIYWEAVRQVAADYSVAVHLVAHDPPRSADDILAQADTAHPVEGWYPTSRWSAGEIVRDSHVLPIPPGTPPWIIRIALYRSKPEGGFENTAWLSIPLKVQ